MPVSARGNGQAFTMKIGYDSGCSTMAIPLADIVPMMAPASVDLLPTVFSMTPSGSSSSRRTSLEVRVLSRDATKVLIPWHLVTCKGYPNIGARILRQSLEDSCFVCSHPHLQRLYVAYSKGQLVNRMPMH